MAAAPTHAGWFRMDAVDDVERRALPEFFDGSSATKTPQAYTHMRNLLVTTYREAPNLHLSVTESRRHIAADVGSVMRLHQFLEHWGLINYCGAHSASNGPVLGSAPPPPSAASATDLSVRAPLALGGGEWSAQETLALVEALDVLGPDASWDDVAAQVGRSAEDCVAHFLALPIEEPYAPMAGSERPNGAPEAADESTNDAMLCQLALLANAVAPTRKRPHDDVEATAAAAAVATATASLQSAARGAASSVLAHAVALHSREDPALGSLFASVVDAQVRLVETKLANLEEVASLMHREREQLERLRSRQRLAACSTHTSPAEQPKRDDAPAP